MLPLWSIALPLSSAPSHGARYFPQQVDHFNASYHHARNPPTWSQAYYVNDTYWNKRQADESPPVFLCVGGEGPPLDASVVSHSVHCNHAVELLPTTNAILFAVEHRYYGCHNASACPYTASDPQPLRYLSSMQALADLATFQAYATKEYSLAATNKWVTFGGSYPGMLASFARIEYPQLFHASISSSAPVYAKLDMTEYNNVVARAFSLASVGGSELCSEAIADGHARVGKMMAFDAGRRELAQMFPLVGAHGADWLLERENQAAFAGNGVAYFPAQDNDPACTGAACNIAKICEIMLSPEGMCNVHRLAKVASAQASGNVIAPRAAMSPRRRHSAPAPRPDAPLDYWGYQTCTEFGFYQTCEVGSSCFFTQGLVLLNESLQFCQEEFGIDVPAIKAAIVATNKRYGGLHPDAPPISASRILYVNGDVDPWSGLGITLPLSETLPAFVVHGASHHAWTHPSKPTDLPSIVDARKRISAQLFEWLDEPADAAK